MYRFNARMQIINDPTRSVFHGVLVCLREDVILMQSNNTKKLFKVNIYPSRASNLLMIFCVRPINFCAIIFSPQWSLLYINSKYSFCCHKNTWNMVTKKKSKHLLRAIPWHLIALLIATAVSRLSVFKVSLAHEWTCQWCRHLWSNSSYSRSS